MFHTLKYSKASLEHHLDESVRTFFQRKTEARSAFANAPVISRALTVPSHFRCLCPRNRNEMGDFFSFFFLKQPPDHESPESHFCLIITKKMRIFSVPSITWRRGAGWDRVATLVKASGCDGQELHFGK